MKKIVSILLVAVLLLGLCACGAASTAEGGAAAETTDAAGGGFRVGYGKADITPEGPVGMGGYGRSDQRLSTGVLSYRDVTCVAISDANDNTILVYGMDLCGSGDAYRFATNVSDATGVPVDNIVMSASHTHSAPDYGVATSGQGAALNKLKKGLIKAAETAMEDRKEATMYAGSAKATGLNFVRRYVMVDGSYAGDNYGNHSLGCAGHETEGDHQLQLLKFTREGGKDIISLPLCERENSTLQFTRATRSNSVMILFSSVCTDLRNFLRAGILKNRFVPWTLLPTGAATGS